jgi:hypothetical protein
MFRNLGVVWLLSINADYGDNNYATNEHTTVDLTIRYDNALQTPTGAGIVLQQEH